MKERTLPVEPTRLDIDPDTLLPVLPRELRLLNPIARSEALLSREVVLETLGVSRDSFLKWLREHRCAEFHGWTLQQATGGQVLVEEFHLYNEGIDNTFAKLQAMRRRLRKKSVRH